MSSAPETESVVVVFAENALETKKLLEKCELKAASLELMGPDRTGNGGEGEREGEGGKMDRLDSGWIHFHPQCQQRSMNPLSLGVHRGQILKESTSPSSRWGGEIKNHWVKYRRLRKHHAGVRRTAASRVPLEDPALCYL